MSILYIGFGGEGMEKDKARKNGLCGNLQSFSSDVQSSILGVAHFLANKTYQ